MLLAPLGLKGYSPRSLITPNGGSYLLDSRKLAEKNWSAENLHHTPPHPQMINGRIPLKFFFDHVEKIVLQ